MDTPPTTPNTIPPAPIEGGPERHIRTFESDVKALGQNVPLPSAEKTVPLETYEGDFLDRVKETKASTLSVLAAEQDLAPRTAQVLTPPKQFSRKNLFYGIAGGVLLVAGGIGVYIAYTQYQSASAPVVPAPTISAPIFVDEREQVSGTGTALVQAITKSTARMIAKGSVRLLYPKDASTGVFSSLQLSAPGALLRNINNTESMAGVVNVSGVQSAFFILSVGAYSETFAGMLSWEQLMPRDLAALFPPYPAPAPAPVATTTASTATSSSKAVVATSTPVIAFPAPAAFHDEVVANHDVRAYLDTAGREVLLYGYWNQTTLVIARNSAAFTEILGRLATSRAQP